MNLSEYVDEIVQMTTAPLSGMGVEGGIGGQFLGGELDTQLIKDQTMRLVPFAMIISSFLMTVVRRKIFRHLLPNTIPIIIVSATLGVAGAIIFESSLRANANVTQQAAGVGLTSYQEMATLDRPERLDQQNQRALNTDQERTMRLREEQLDISKKPQTTGEVNLRKEVVENEQTINVPVSQELFKQTTHMYEQLRESKNANRALCILMIDVDDFKRINDVYGHQEGDKVLERVADLIQASIGEEDRVGRYGGEEFMVAIPDGTLEQCVQKAELIRKNVEKAVITSALGIPIPITVSIGGATLNTREYALEQMIN